MICIILVHQFFAGDIYQYIRGHIKTIIWTSKQTPEQIWLVCTFFSRSNHLMAPFFSVIFTRRRPISSQGHGLIDFYFHSIFPWSLLSCQPPWNKTLKRRRKKKTRLLTLQGSTKVCRKLNDCVFQPEKKLLFEATERSK